MYNLRKSCRCCDSQKLVKFLDLGMQPLANSFLTKIEDKHTENLYPLEVYFCENCNFVQLLHIVSKEILFRNYVYFSSAMPKVSTYWMNYANFLIDNFLKDTNDLVVEIGSNDGILLNFFKENKFKVLGVDPAENIAEAANRKGITTLAEFFDESIGERILNETGPAKVIMANNVFAHVDDLNSICSGVAKLLLPDGVFCVEAPYLCDMFENLTYDTVYHEHVSYLSVRPLIHLFQKFGLEIFDIKIVPAQGQSLRLFVGHKNKHPVQNIVQNLMEKEIQMGMDNLNAYKKLAQRIQRSSEELKKVISTLKNESKSIAAYGAPAKGNTLLNYCSLDNQSINFALEDLESKHNLFTPGTHIPVQDREFANANPPDYYLLLAWNYLNPILEKEVNFRENGGKFIIPVGDEINII